MDDEVRDFVEKRHGAVMATTKKDGLPHLARIDVGVVDGKLWSSGTRTRVRTKHLRRDPRATLMILDDSTPYKCIRAYAGAGALLALWVTRRPKSRPA